MNAPECPICHGPCLEWAVCELCWASFESEEELTQHVAGECVTEFEVSL